MLQQQQSSISRNESLTLPRNESLTPPGNESLIPPGGGQGGPVGPNLPWRRRGRGIIVISAGISAIATLLLVITIGSIILAMQTRNPPPTYQYQKVTQGNIALTVNMAGTLQGGTYNVVFSGSGKIAEVDVKVGQAVNKGQVLAKLDKTSLEDAVRQAQTGVTIAETTLNNGQTGSNATQGLSGSNIAAAQTTLNNAQVNLKKVKAQSGASVAAAQTGLDNAQTNLSHTQVQSAASITPAQTTLSNAQTSLSQAQATAAADKLAMTQACPPNPTPIPPAPTCADATAAYNAAVAQVNADQAAVNTAQSALNTAQKQASATNAAAQGQVDTAQNALNTAQKQAATSNATAQAQVNSAQSALNVAISSANLSNTTAQAQVNSAQSALVAALATLETAEHNLAFATLTAPHGGTVTVINGTIGGTPGVPISGSTSSGTVSGTFIQIIDSSVLQVQGNLNESNAAMVRIGEPAQFTVSAFGKQKFGGTVSAIAPIGVTVSNVVTFPVTVDVDMNSLRDATLIPGMTANVTIYVVQRSNVLLIPVKAVNFARTAPSIKLISPQQAASALAKASLTLQQLQIENPAISMDNPFPAFVLEQSNGQFVAKPVVLGLTDGTNYEVLEGLVLGETIVVGTQSGS